MSPQTNDMGEILIASPNGDKYWADPNKKTIRKATDIDQAQQQPQPSMVESGVRGIAQSGTLGFADELEGVGGAIRGAIDPNMTISEGYRSARDASRAEYEAAQKANPKSYLAGELAGGAATMLIPGGAAVKGVTTLGKVAKMGATGAAIGAGAGLGGSEGDLRENIIDTAKGAAIGGTIGAIAQPVTNLVGAALNKTAQKLTELGEARLFKAAVGQTKRAFTQMDAKGLLDKAGQYLNKMGIGFGDSTESIAEKIATRKESIGAALSDTVAALDDAAGGVVKVSPNVVAKRIVDEVAEPLKKLAAARGEYKQVMQEAKAIIRDGNKIRKNITFKEAVEQRQAAQAQAKYDKIQGKSIAEEAKQKIAQIWNEEIDKQAEPLLKQAGKAGDAYRELRHEYGLVTELDKHIQNRAAGNAANRVLSPSDYGVGGVASIMTSNPFLGIAGAIANHTGRVYGNAAAGRSAILAAKLASVNKLAANKILPTSLLSSIPAIAINEGENK